MLFISTFHTSLEPPKINQFFPPNTSDDCLIGMKPLQL